MSQFPVEVLEDILSRLPVKCLLRLRAVSKSWLALISNPSFVKLHLNRSAQTKINRSLFLSYNKLVYRSDFDSLDVGVIQPAVVDYHPLNFEKVYMIWGSCDGLICISYCDNTVFLWNPSTRKSLKLPHESLEVPKKSNLQRISCYAIGYTCNDYKVVRTVDVFDPRGDFFDYEIKIYSVNSNSWHRPKKFPHFQSADQRSGNIIVGGALHWIFDLEAEWHEKSRIVAFDLGTEEYRFIPEPEYRNPHVQRYLLNIEGCLALSCQYNDSMTADIWLLKDYGGKNEFWLRLITMLPIIRTAIPSLTPIAYSKSGKKVLMEMDCEKLFWYNLERKSVEDIIVHGKEEEDGLLEGVTCLESLASLDVKVAAANAKRPQEDYQMLRVLKKIKLSRDR